MFDFWNNEAEDCSCAECKKENDCENKFCIYCGKHLPTEEERQLVQNLKNTRKCKCNKCSHKNDCNDEFCMQCGNALKGSMSDEELYDHVMMSLDGIVIALLAKIAKIGGRIGKKEIDFFRNAFAVLAKKRSQSKQIVNIYAQILDHEKRNLANVDTLCRKISSMKIMRDLKIEIIRLFVELGYLDKNYQSKQEEIILKVVERLSLEPLIYQNIKHEYDPEDRTLQTKDDELTLESSYAILELTPRDPSNVVKRNYRRLVRQYHYDSIVSKDLPDDMLHFAEEKLKRINAAYAIIKEEQGK